MNLTIDNIIYLKFWKIREILKKYEGKDLHFFKKKKIKLIW